jgi:hypothetical protein
MLEKLAKALGITVRDFFPESNSDCTTTNATETKKKLLRTATRKREPQ